ncbi:hypothetical protein COB87_001030 [Candidatus Wolfebacteria bacterium]|nr:hypothetical protein [Candidatus Wolfebacteria bacterium]
MESVKPKIGVLHSAAMLLVAGMFDLMQIVITMFGFLPTIVTQVLAFTVALPMAAFAYLLFLIWFAFLNVPFFNIKKPMSFLGKTGGLVVESLPFLTAIPILSANVLFTLIEANGTKGFPASLVPKVFLKATPMGKVVKTITKISK